jgi:1-acyl-sn-glycerol-3-phosphate acyltransferase
MTMHAWYLQRGAEPAVFALVQREAFQIPYLNVHVMKLGGIAATARMAVKALESGAPLALYPGAGNDVYRPYEQRHTISFFGQDALIRLALRFGLAIVPVVAIGSHETLLVFDDGANVHSDGEALYAKDRSVFKEMLAEKSSQHMTPAYQQVPIGQ